MLAKWIRFHSIPFHPLDEKSIRGCIGNSDLVINLVGKYHPTENLYLRVNHTHSSFSLQIPRHPIDFPERLARICNELCKTRLLLVSALQPNLHPGSEWVRSKGTRLFPSTESANKGEEVLREVLPSAASCVLRTGSAKMTACWPGRTAGKGDRQDRQAAAHRFVAAQSQGRKRSDAVCVDGRCSRGDSEVLHE